MPNQVDVRMNSLTDSQMTVIMHVILVTMTNEGPCHLSAITLTAPRLSLSHERLQELSHWAFQLRDGGWSHVFITDRFFVPESNDPKLLNPWNGLPKYWTDMVRAVAAVNLDEANFRSKPKGRCCSCF